MNERTLPAEESTLPSFCTVETHPSSFSFARLKELLLIEGGLPIIWIVLSVGVLVPVWHQRLLPMLDTPNHLGLVRGWHNYHDAAYKIAEYYTLRIRPVPYLLFYFLIHMLMYVVNIEVANKIYLSAYLLLFPLSVLALTRAFRRTPWLALGGFLLEFNQNWIYGFSSFLMSVVFMFFSLAALVQYLNADDDRLPIWLGVSGILCYFSHVESWVCLGLCAMALWVLYSRRWRRCLVSAVALSPTLLLAIGSYLAERNSRSYFKAGNGISKLSGVWRDFPTAIWEFPRRVMELFPGNIDRNILIVLVSTGLGLIIWRGTSLRDDSEEQRKQLWVLLVVLLIVYVTLPYEIYTPMSWWYVSPRLPAMMAPLILMLPALPRISGWQRLLCLPIAISSVVLSVKLTVLYSSFSRRNIGFMKLVQELPKGARVMTVVRGMMRGPGSEELSGDPATSGPVYWHFSSWPMALNGGYGPHLFDQGIPIVPKEKYKAPGFGGGDGFELRQAPDFEYYLVRSPSDDMEWEPSLKALDRFGEWVLFKRIYKLTDEP